jgi:hypothetical protein
VAFSWRILFLMELLVQNVATSKVLRYNPQVMMETVSCAWLEG